MPIGEEEHWFKGAAVLRKTLARLEKTKALQSPAEKCGALLVALMQEGARKAKDEEQSLAQFEHDIAETNKMFLDMSRIEFRRLWGDIK